MNDAREFSWLKALAHSVAIGFVFFLPAIVFSAAGVVNATKAGEFSGGFIVPALVLGWIWSYARQRSHPTLMHTLTFILVAMSAYEVFVLATAAATRKKLPSMSALEAHPPTLHRSVAGAVLCQQDVGLRLPLGDTSLSPAPDLAAALNKKETSESLARWVYRESAGDIVLVMAANGFDSEASLHNFLTGASKAAQEHQMVKTQEFVEWRADHGTILLSFRQGDKSHFDMRCVSATNGNLACLQTLGPGPDRLAALRDGLSLAACP